MVFSCIEFNSMFSNMLLNIFSNIFSDMVNSCCASEFEKFWQNVSRSCCLVGESCITLFVFDFLDKNR